MVNLHKKDRAFAFQIRELQEYILYLEEKITRYKKQGRNPERLKDNKARALRTIEQLKQAKISNILPLQPKRELESNETIL